MGHQGKGRRQCLNHVWGFLDLTSREYVWSRESWEKAGFPASLGTCICNNIKMKGDQAGGVSRSGYTTGRDALMVENEFPFVDEQSKVQ